jgi:hypothetical protein
MEDLNAPATKGDLQRFATKDDLQRFATKDDLQRFATKDDLQQVKDEIIEVKDEIIEAMRNIQTEMLNAFYSYAQTNDLKMKQAETIDNQLRERLSVVESRITEIERRLNMPPAA